MKADAVRQAREAGKRLFHFHGGLRLRHNKKISCGHPLEKSPLPPRLYVPLLQHTGREAEPTVSAGQKVLKGDQIGCFGHLGRGCIHAPTSGTVSAVIRHPNSHPSGEDGLCVVIRPDGLDQWKRLEPVPDWRTADPADLRHKIRQSGIVGLGLLIAALSESFEGHSVLMSFIVMPMFILSGAFFPIDRLPSWLAVLVGIDPLSYGVDLLRHLMLGTGANALTLDLGVLMVFTSATILASARAFEREF